MTKLQQIQTILGVPADNRWGPVSQAALDREKSVLVAVGKWHSVLASSFADKADVAAFRACKATGKSDEECFKVGDNGVGCWGDDCAGGGPMCALPPEDMEDKFGSVAAAKHASVKVVVGSRKVVCTLADRMPHRAAITNHCGIDLNPAACIELGLRPPMTCAAEWAWA